MMRKWRDSLVELKKCRNRFKYIERYWGDWNFVTIKVLFKIIEGKDGLFNKGYWDNWIFFGKNIKLDLNFIIY